MQTAVVALGGNALLRRKERPAFSTQSKNISTAVKNVLPLIRKYKVVLTHGNGPQVGNILIQIEEALGKAYPVPLFVAVAESEGEIGYMIEQSLYNELRAHHINKPVITILTQVIVDKKDKMFRKPTKPVGPFYDVKHAAILRKKGFTMAKVIGGYRRVVPSPNPLEIVEAKTINSLLNSGTIVIAAGGGGIPVYKEKNRLKGIDAVIDKDLASACLAKSIKADIFLILTDVNKVYLNYKKPDQKALNKINISAVKKYMKGGHFPAGSMGPKVQAAINFLKSGGKKVIITNPESLEKALKGKEGTVITKS